MKILLAVSGGLDSMTMSYLALRAVKGDFYNPYFERFQDAELGIAHCNFHLRPGECDEDAALVESWAAQHGLAFHRADFETEKYAQEHAVSLEMAARELRYRFFAECCCQYGYRFVCVAHNADDNAETLLLNLLRGCGLKGIQAMREESALPYADEEEGASQGQTNVLLLRPLLSSTRSDLEKVAHEQQIPYHEDRTNAEPFCKRNILRNKVFPILKEINPSFVGNFQRDIENFRRAGSALDAYLSPLLTSLAHQDAAGAISYRLADFPAEAKEELLYRILSQFGFQQQTFKSILQLKNMGETRCYMSKTHRLQVKDKQLFFRPIGEVVLPVTCEVNYIAYQDDMSLKTPRGTSMLDADALPSDACLRAWENGDWICPLGMGGKRKKISDLFVDLHYTQEDKKRALVLAEPDSHHVYALVGERIDEAVKVLPGRTQTLMVLKITEC